MSLRQLVIHRAQITPMALAVRGPDASLTYDELDCLANRFAHTLARLNVRQGDRIGLWLDKSAAAVAAMQGVLRLRAVYVPLDPLSPASRINTIMHDCAMRTIITTRRRAESLSATDLDSLACLCLDDGDALALEQTPIETPEPPDDELAYILYTSGSTGKPKGVCISQRNALAFVEWTADVLQTTPTDRFANHAPFHFDLSVLDLYVAFASGAAVFLIPDTISYLPRRLVDYITQERLTIWYSVPSALILMMQEGGLLDLPSLPLRAFLFAGEPFPIKHLQRLHQRWSRSARFLNLYGPTETNVCTYYEVDHIPEDQTHSVPIGKACSGDYVWARKEDGYPTHPGETGELIVEGPSVMLGYWGQEAQGQKPYATGDLVRLQEDGQYVYLGRRDHLVKVRGHRIELAEIEATLMRHPAINACAVLVVGTDLEARLLAVIVPVTSSVPPLLELKRHCAEHLPRYMIVDDLLAVAELPYTRNGKIDRQELIKIFHHKNKHTGEQRYAVQ